jgi:hypothetical protein
MQILNTIITNNLIFINFCFESIINTISLIFYTIKLDNISLIFEISIEIILGSVILTMIRRAIERATAAIGFGAGVTTIYTNGKDIYKDYKDYKNKNLGNPGDSNNSGGSGNSGNTSGNGNSGNSDNSGKTGNNAGNSGNNQNK